MWQHIENPAMTGSDTKNCFVTIGATASFASLIKAVLARDVCQTLKDLGYDRLLIQYGHDGQELFDTCLQNLKQHERESLIIEGFDLDQSGLAAHMRDAKGSNGKEGVVISHAGTRAHSIMFAPTLAEINRLWYHTRCLTNRRPSRGCAQRGAVG
jgi:UDP-N-acetylglucosamine transferase subunit ALG13